VFNFKNANWSALKELLMHTPWEMAFVKNDINNSLSIWCDLFFAAVNEHIPKCTKRCVTNQPWIDTELLKLIRKKTHQRRIASRTKLPIEIEKFKTLRRKTKQMIAKKRKDHAYKIRDSLAENPKRFWALIKSSTITKPIPKFLRDGQLFVTDNKAKAELLNKYFHSVFATPDQHQLLQSQLSDVVTQGAVRYADRLSNIELTESEVANVLKSLDPNKACGPGGIPNRLLQNVATEIAPSLCKLFNLSLSQGVVPSEWKLANLSPILKTDDPTLSSNYRPISLLNTISKVLERCVFNHCSKHLEPQIYHLQHGFMKGRSTVTQLVEVYDDIVNSVASGKEVDVLYLDLAKAFDKVPHNLLLLKLQLHGITGQLLLWMQSYLSERKQRVVLEGASSDWLPVTSGVPQGSILGPLLFLVYVNDVPSCIINNSNIALFADDSKLYRAMGTNYDHNLLQADLDCLHTWSLSSGLDFNSRKCKVLHISKKKSTREMNRNYSLGDQPIECVSSFVDLGITISHNLSWADHIEKIVVKANKTLGLMKRIFRDLQDIQTRKIIYCALVRPKLEYGSSL
jgi:hypothetical protein